jgi:hypothetical protein
LDFFATCTARKSKKFAQKVGDFSFFGNLYWADGQGWRRYSPEKLSHDKKRKNSEKTAKRYSFSN